MDRFTNTRSVIQVPLAKCAKSRTVSPPSPPVQSTGTTESVLKMRWAASISTAMAVNRPLPNTVQRTDPRKSDVSVVVNASSMNQEVCPLASRGISTSSSATPPLINRQRTPTASSPRLCSAVAVRIPPGLAAGREQGILDGFGLAPTPATPIFGTP